MKVKEFMSKFNFAPGEDDCALCSLHASFNRGMECPKCGAELDIEDAKMTVVGESNSVDPDEKIYMVPKLECFCGASIALMPTEIIWNANHDVYYTGGRKYVMGDINFKHRLLPHIQQYHERILNGEELRPFELEAWLQYEIEHILAEYLYDQGLKK